MLDLYSQMGMTPPQFTGFFNLNTVRNTKIAAAIRKLVKLPVVLPHLGDRDSFNYLRAKFEDAGILAFQAVKVDPLEMRGLSVSEDIFPIIAVNQHDSYYARNFTLFHELAHLITRTAGICNEIGFSRNSSHQIEYKCNDIAALVLVPDDLFLNNKNTHTLLQNWNDDLVRRIASSFYVSREVIIGRLYSLQQISLDFYKQKLDQYTKEYIADHNPPKKNTSDPIPQSYKVGPQFGKMYVGTVLNAYNQEIISPLDAVQFLNGLRLKHFDSLERWCFS
jgi:Zn-dependent peptidase ImmA (M78 family)